MDSSKEHYNILSSSSNKLVPLSCPQSWSRSDFHDTLRSENSLTRAWVWDTAGGFVCLTIFSLNISPDTETTTQKNHFQSQMIVVSLKQKVPKIPHRVLKKLQSNNFPLKLLIGCNFYQVSSTSIFSRRKENTSFQLQDNTSLERVRKEAALIIWTHFNSATSNILFIIPKLDQSMNNIAAKNISIFFLDIVTKDLASQTSITKSKWREYRQSPCSS